MVGVAAGLANGGRIAVRLGRRLFPHRPGAGADQGRCGLLQQQHQAVWHEPGDGVRGTGTDAPLDRGHRLAAGDRQHDHHRAGRPDRNRGCAALGRGHGGSGVPPGQPDGGAGGLRRPTTNSARQGGRAARGWRRDPDLQRHSDLAGVGRGRTAGGRGVAARVLSMPTVKPLDVEAVVAAADETGASSPPRSDHRRGLGGAVAETVVSAPPDPRNGSSGCPNSPRPDRRASSWTVTACRPRASRRPPGSSHASPH